MALQNIIGHVTPGRKLCMFEIRPESEFIVFRGPASETPATTLKGSVVIMTTDSIQSKGGIKIVLEGRRRTQHWNGKPEFNSLITNKGTFLRMEVKLSDHNGNSIRSLPPGNHTFPFEFPLDGDLSESIEGLHGNYVTYDLRAVCERGVLAKDMITRKPIRIIRTLGPDALESAAAQAVSGIWPEKIKYLFEPVSRSFIYGTTMATDLELTPLLDKLRIEKIKFTLKETRRIKTLPGPDMSPNGTTHGMWKEEEDVYFETMQVPPNCEETDVDTQLPMFKFRATWNLPKSLAKCRQTVEEGEWLRVSHSAHYDVVLRNPDGHLSELKAHHPLRLFISPNLHFDDSNSVITTPTHTPGERSDPLDITAPPTYGTHQLDVLVPLYEGIDPNGFFTPGTLSGAATPFGGHSRNTSADNLAAFFDGSNHANPNVLSNRLRRLQMTSDSTSPRQNSLPSSFPSSFTRHGGNTPEDVLSPQRSNSSGGSAGHGGAEHISGSATPHHRNNNYSTSQGGNGDEAEDFDMDQLMRMPTYNTAVKSSTRPVSAAEGLPTYAAATSRPPSPQLQAPSRAHVRTGFPLRGSR